jgi:hypothetical protein
VSQEPDSSGSPSALAVALLIALASLPCLVAAPAHAAPKTDVIVLLNGDRITCEVKELLYGQLKIKTDDIGTIYIEWNKIASLTTTQHLQIDLADGRHLFGRAPEAGSKTAMLRLASDQDGEGATAIEVPMSDIVRVATSVQGEAWYRRLDGSVSVGYSYTQANSLQTFSFAGDVYSRTSKHRWEIALNTQMSDDASGPGSQSSYLSGTVERFLPDRYFQETQLVFSRNKELGLDLRGLIGALYGRYLQQREGREWRTAAGLAASSESSADGTHRNVLWAQLGTDLRIFRLDSPKTNVTATLAVLPAVSEWGRVRGEARIDARHELITDFFFELTYSDSYDSRPSSGAEKNDWYLSTSLGYTF